MGCISCMHALVTYQHQRMVISLLCRAAALPPLAIPPQLCGGCQPVMLYCILHTAHMHTMLTPFFQRAAGSGQHLLGSIGSLPCRDGPPEDKAEKVAEQNGVE